MGCDCNYIESWWCSPLWTLSIIDLKWPSINNNPNYWFSDYQKKGDRFNLPGASTFQMGSWANIQKYCPSDVEIINNSTISKIPYFTKKNIFLELLIQKKKQN